MKKLNITLEERKERIREQKRQEYKRHKERYNKNSKEYHLKNREEILKKQKEYHWNNRDKLLKQRKNRYHMIDKKNPEIMKRKSETARIWDIERRRKCIEHYSKGKTCCELCGESDYDVLTIDHINGGGNQHRIKISRHVADFLIKNNFPEGYRILCMNCNIKEARRKGFYGTRKFK
jgi:hypothetical protein